MIINVERKKDQFYPELMVGWRENSQLAVDLVLYWVIKLARTCYDCTKSNYWVNLFSQLRRFLAPLNLTTLAWFGLAWIWIEGMDLHAQSRLAVGMCRGGEKISAAGTHASNLWCHVSVRREPQRIAFGLWCLCIKGHDKKKVMHRVSWQRWVRVLDCESARLQPE